MKNDRSWISRVAVYMYPPLLGSFGSPMLLSPPDPLNSSLMCTEIIDIDLLEDDNCAICGEYARDIFSYLREAEVQ